MTYPQTYTQAWQWNKVTERKKTEFRSLGKAGLEGNWNYPLSIEGVVPMFRSPCRAFSCRLTYPHKPFRVYTQRVYKEIEMGKMYAGNLPTEDDGWNQIGKCWDSDEVEWLVFSRPQDHTPDWMTYKIVANGRARNKANYWLVKNIETGQIGFARDYVHMRDNRPELHAQVEAIFKKVILK